VEGLKQYGWTGVDLFFVLSGYLIGTQLFSRLARGQRLSLRDFYVRRALRILPAFLTVASLSSCGVAIVRGAFVDNYLNRGAA
jgi:peptidoglycan/LPS O-acetylase OafA/YrhL